MQLSQKVLKLSILLVVLSTFCQKNHAQEMADMILFGGTIYTMDTAQMTVETVATRDGKIIYAGNMIEAKNHQDSETIMYNLKGNTMYPGFVESHGHLYGMGLSKSRVDLSNVSNYDEMVAYIDSVAQGLQAGEWILGRGWHQEKWNERGDDWVNDFPTHKALSKVTPDNPLFLTRAGGHSAMVNQNAMQLAGITKGNIPEVEGGTIDIDDNGNPTGIFHESAMMLIQEEIGGQMSTEEKKEVYLTAIRAVQKNGVTSFHDAGISGENLRILMDIKESGKLGLRLYEMLSGSDEELVRQWVEKGPLQDTDNLLSVRSIKLYADGALGNRGAWFTEEYTDKPGHYGIPVMPMDYIRKIAELGVKNGFQICTHAIGDRANHEVLDIYEEISKEYPDAVEDARFRVEHAQHLVPEDIPRFAELNVIASMQGIHMASDRPWAIDRLGEKRIVEGAYVWQKLLKSGATIINGTDVPVEPIDIIDCFYALVTRKTLAGTPEKGYEPAQKMSRMEALKAYTLDAAYGAFQEESLGSIEVGKLADFTILNQNIIETPSDQIRQTEVAATILGGELVYEK